MLKGCGEVVEVTEQKTVITRTYVLHLPPRSPIPLTALQLVLFYKLSHYVELFFLPVHSNCTKLHSSEALIQLVRFPTFIFIFFKNIFKIFVGPRPNLWSHWLLLFWTSCVLPHGFQIQSGSLACTLSCLHAVIPRIMSGTTPALSANRGVHYASIYMAWQPSHFDPRTCSRQTYPQALVVPRSEFIFIIEHFPSNDTYFFSTYDVIIIAFVRFPALQNHCFKRSLASRSTYSLLRHISFRNYG